MPPGRSSPPRPQRRAFAPVLRMAHQRNAWIVFGGRLQDFPRAIRRGVVHDNQLRHGPLGEHRSDHLRQRGGLVENGHDRRETRLDVGIAFDFAHSLFVRPSIRIVRLERQLFRIVGRKQARPERYPVVGRISKNGSLSEDWVVAVLLLVAKVVYLASTKGRRGTGERRIVNHPLKLVPHRQNGSMPLSPALSPRRRGARGATSVPRAMPLPR